jgi:hypothetical protein
MPLRFRSFHIAAVFIINFRESISENMKRKKCICRRAIAPVACVFIQRAAVRCLRSENLFEALSRQGQAEALILLYAFSHSLNVDE